MVKEVSGQWQNYREVMRKLGVTSEDGYRRIVFPFNDLNNQRERDVVKELAGYPDYDKQSFLLKDTVDGSQFPMDVLVVPRECPDIIPTALIRSGETPDPTETHLAKASRNNMVDERITLLVLAGDISSARRIASREASLIFKSPPEELLINAELVTPEQFIDEAKKLIDKGIRVNDRFLRFADLRSYYQAHQSRVQSGGQFEQVG